MEQSKSKFIGIYNNKGETLITVMIAIGLMAIVISGATMMFSNLQKSEKTISVKGSMDNLRSETLLAFANKNVCTMNLQGLSIPPVGTNNIVTVGKNLTYGNSNPLVERNKNLNGYQVSQIQLTNSQPLNPLSTSDYVVRLKLVMTSDQIVGATTIERSFPIHVTMNGSSIQECVAVGGSGDVDITAKADPSLINRISTVEQRVQSAIDTANAAVNAANRAPSGTCPAKSFWTNSSSCGGASESSYRTSYNNQYISLSDGYPTQIGGTSGAPYQCLNGRWTSTKGACSENTNGNDGNF